MNSMMTSVRVLERQDSSLGTAEKDDGVYEGITEIKIITKVESEDNSIMDDNVNHYLGLDLDSDEVSHTDFMTMSLQNIEISKDILSRAKCKMDLIGSKFDRYKSGRGKRLSSSFDCRDEPEEREEDETDGREAFETKGDIECQMRGQDTIDNTPEESRKTLIKDTDNDCDDDDDWLVFVEKVERTRSFGKYEETRIDGDGLSPKAKGTKGVQGMGSKDTLHRTAACSGGLKSPNTVLKWKSCKEDSLKGDMSIADNRASYRNANAKRSNALTNSHRTPTRIVNYDFDEAERCRSIHVTTKRKESLSRGLGSLRRHSVSTTNTQSAENTSKDPMPDVRSKFVQRLAQTRPKLARAATFPSLSSPRPSEESSIKNQSWKRSEKRDLNRNNDGKLSFRELNTPVYNLSGDTSLPMMHRVQRRNNDNQNSFHV